MKIAFAFCAKVSDHLSTGKHEGFHRTIHTTKSCLSFHLTQNYASSGGIYPSFHYIPIYLSIVTLRNQTRCIKAPCVRFIWWLWALLEEKWIREMFPCCTADVPVLRCHRAWQARCCNVCSAPAFCSGQHSYDAWWMSNLKLLASAGLESQHVHLLPVLH